MKRISKLIRILVGVAVFAAVLLISLQSPPPAAQAPSEASGSIAPASTRAIDPSGTVAMPSSAFPEAAAPDVPPPAEAPAASSGPWWQVYFVSPVRLSEAQEIEYAAGGLPSDLLGGSVAEALIGHIDAAQTSIHIAAFETNSIDVANALIRARQRGVDVRWVTDDEHGLQADADPGHGQIALMRSAGIDFRDDGRSGLMHNKFFIFDRQVVWTGSTNITISGMFEQDNNAIAITSPDLASIYERQFEELWSGQFGSSAPSGVMAQSVVIDGTPVQALFSPEDDAIARLVPYLQSAQESIRFMSFSFTNDALGEAIAERAAAGVVVVGVFESTGSYTPYSEMSSLFCLPASLSVTVKTDGNGSFMHHKVILVDDHTLITGSLNFSNNANENNNENILVIQNPDIVEKYVREFDRVAGFGSSPDTQKVSCE